jgi:chromosome segregation ATPase
VQTFGDTRALKEVGLPRVAWVLTISAFLCGGMISAAIFSVGWKHEAQKGSSAQSALAAADSRVNSLTAQLQDERARSASLATAQRALTNTNGTLRHELAQVRKAIAHAKQVTNAVTLAAAPLSGDLDRVTSELRTLTGYLNSTPLGQLDAGYVQAQVAYLSKTVATFRTEVAAVQAQAQ